MKQDKAGWEGLFSLAGCDQSGNDFKAADQVSNSIGLWKTGMAVSGCQSNVGDIAGGVNNTQFIQATQLSSDLCPKAALGESHVDNCQIWPMSKAENHGLSNRAGNTADLISTIEENLFDHIGDHKIVFNNQNFSHQNHP